MSAPPRISRRFLLWALHAESMDPEVARSIDCELAGEYRARLSRGAVTSA